jgi:hypothetical protein
MAIPELNNGLFRPGVHDATMAEVEKVLGSSSDRRIELFAKLSRFVDLARVFSIFKAIYLDGSFVSDKADPGDIDAVRSRWMPKIYEHCSFIRAERRSSTLAP